MQLDLMFDLDLKVLEFEKIAKIRIVSFIDFENHVETHIQRTYQLKKITSKLGPNVLK
jgi:hypothetical protein